MEAGLVQSLISALLCAGTTMADLIICLVEIRLKL